MLSVCMCDNHCGLFCYIHMSLVYADSRYIDSISLICRGADTFHLGSKHIVLVHCRGDIFIQLHEEGGHCIYTLAMVSKLSPTCLIICC
jgi:hypothetical protein